MSQNQIISGSYDMNVLREPVLRAMIKDLNLPEGSHGLDNGCGIGFQSIMLAEETGPGGRITGLDISSEILDVAVKTAADAGMSERVSFRQGDAADLPFADESFDWALSIDCVGYGSRDTLHLLDEMKRVVKTGGMVAVAAWSSEILLPGYPELEARLGVTSSGIAPFIKGRSPEEHLFRNLGRFRKLGLTELSARAYAGSVHAPLNEASRKALSALFDMRWPGVESELSSADVKEYRRLCSPDSEDFILDIPDYYAQYTYTLFRGTKS